jgi:hypothetical protein
MQLTARKMWRLIRSCHFTAMLDAQRHHDWSRQAGRSGVPYRWRPFCDFTVEKAPLKWCMVIAVDPDDHCFTRSCNRGYSRKVHWPLANTMLRIACRLEPTMKDACNAWHIHITFVMPTADDCAQPHARTTCNSMVQLGCRWLDKEATS